MLIGIDHYKRDTTPQTMQLLKTLSKHDPDYLKDRDTYIGWYGMPILDNDIDLSF